MLIVCLNICVNEQDEQTYPELAVFTFVLWESAESTLSSS